jgi:acyl-coenzyme A thioesterase PaaI-like protein
MHPTGVHQSWCFGCGEDNPCASLFHFTQIGNGQVVALARFTHRHQGSTDLAHGGALAAAIDDTYGALVLAIGAPAVTARLEINYRASVPLNHDVRIESRVDRVDGRKLWLSATALDGEALLAESSALFLTVDAERVWSPVMLDAWKRDRGPTT